MPYWSIWLIVIIAFLLGVKFGTWVERGKRQDAATTKWCEELKDVLAQEAKGVGVTCPRCSNPVGSAAIADGCDRKRVCEWCGMIVIEEGDGQCAEAEVVHPDNNPCL